MSDESSNNIQMLLHKQAAKMDFMEKQNEQMIWLLKGNPNLKIKGVFPILENLQSDVALLQTDVKEVKKWNGQIAEIRKDLNDVKNWREAMWKVDFKKFVTKESINMAVKIILGLVGLGTGAYGVIELINKLAHG